MQQALPKSWRARWASVPPPGPASKHPHQDFQQIDTNQHPVICGGAFGPGLDKIVANRIGKKVMGFGAEIQARPTRTAMMVLAQCAAGGT